MSLAIEVDLIRRVPVFSAIGPDKQKLLCFSSERLTFEPGQVMFREGDAADAAMQINRILATRLAITTARLSTAV